MNCPPGMSPSQMTKTISLNFQVPADFDPTSEAHADMKQVLLDCLRIVTDAGKLPSPHQAEVAMALLLDF